MDVKQVIVIRPAATCSCLDPIVFGHAPPCPEWESTPGSFRPCFAPRPGVNAGLHAELAAIRHLTTAMQQLTEAMQPLTGNAIQSTGTGAALSQHGGPGEDAQD